MLTGEAAPAKKPAAAARMNRSVLEEELPAGPGPVQRVDPRNFRKLEEGELPLAAKGAIVIDSYTGRTLYAKNADVPRYPASTTKIMTALLVIETAGKRNP